MPKGRGSQRRRKSKRQRAYSAQQQVIDAFARQTAQLERNERLELLRYLAKGGE